MENSVSIAATFEIEYLQYLDATGKLVRDDLPAFARDTRQLVKLYQEMVMARVFDAKAIALQRTGKLGTYAPCLGHEATYMAIGSAMQEDDSFACSYREYGAQFHRGVKPRELLMYWGGDERGNDFSGPRMTSPGAFPSAPNACMPRVPLWPSRSARNRAWPSARLAMAAPRRRTSTAP